MKDCYATRMVEPRTRALTAIFLSKVKISGPPRRYDWLCLKLELLILLDDLVGALLQKPR